jgi:hypothetical protein
MQISRLDPVDKDGLNRDRAPRMPFYSLWTGANGLSHLATCMLDGFVKKSIGGKAAPMWMREFPEDVETMFFSILPVGWIGEWHESPSPQWVVPLSGRWFIETQYGSRIEMGPGDIHWGQDIGTASVDGNHGHRSGQLGPQPCIQLMIRFRTPIGNGSACPF